MPELRRTCLHLVLDSAQAHPADSLTGLTGSSRDTSRVLSPATSLYCRSLFCADFPFAGRCFSPGLVIEARRPQSVFTAGPGLLLAGVAAGGPLGLLSEAAGEGVRVGRHGAGQGAVAGIDAEVTGEVVLGVPGGGADRG